MSPVTRSGQGEQSREEVLQAMLKALEIERRSRYADFHGKRSTFSQFMRQTSARLCKQYPLESSWITIRGLFRQYPNTDVATRISIVRRAGELLAPHIASLEEASVNLKNEVVAELSSEEAASLSAADSKDSGLQESAELKEVIASSGLESSPEPGDEVSSASPDIDDASSAAANVLKGSPRRDTRVDKGVRTMAGKSEAGAEMTSDRSGSGGGSEQASNSAKLARFSSDAKSKNPDDVGVQFVKGVGPKMSSVLSRLGIDTVGDLIRHYPRRHLDFQNRLLIKDLEEGQEVSIFGVIRSVSAFQSKRRNISVLTVVIADSTGSINITRFVGGRSNKYLLDRYKAQFPKGAQVLASGVVEKDRYSRKFQLKNAEVEVLGLASDQSEREGGEQASLHAGRLVPVYPLTDGLSLRHLRTVIHNALEKYGGGIKDPLPEDLRTACHLMDLQEALYVIHFPDDVESKDEARRRLVFDELFAIQLQLAHRRYKFDLTEGALALEYSSDGLVKKLVDSLPFKLTGAQERVFKEIAKDLESTKPMHRLVQGDVGSGKTVVALMAFLVAIENSFQGAMMAPTEILAEQHFRQFERLLTPLGLRCTLVLGKQGVRVRREVRQQILSGQVHIAVGTHALLEDDVEFQNLGLIIIDEQHRFGVKQRARLKAKSQNPELLTMTATPIPRTLAMTMHGDLDVSEIDEMPPGRKPIKTKFVRAGARREMWSFVESEVAKGRQTYVVFPLIEESESLSAKAATKEYEKLKRHYTDKDGTERLRFGLMHGKLKPKDKDEIMERFRDGEFDVLVSTTVIEVGVDVPNATTMIIENADRFGLAQLHQLRGRVGRGSDQSYCFLVSDSKGPATRERLDILTQTNDGFVVAEKDLEIRGPGEFLGYRQSGLPDLVLADLVNDAKILEDARNTAIGVIKADPELARSPELRALLDKRLRTSEAEVMRSG